ELRQVLEQTADDLDFENQRAITFPDTIRYASEAGTDQFTGHGRINAHAAVARILAGNIPPEAEIRSPVWFQPLDPRRDGSFGVDGASSPAVADLDGDGVGDIVFGTSNGLVYAKHADGSDLRGWPVATDPLAIVAGSAAYASKAIPTPIRAAVLASVVIGDIDGDGLL